MYFLDSLDIAGVNIAILIGLITLLPLMSEPLIAFLQDKIEIKDETATIVKQKVWLRAAFVILCLVTNLLTVLVSVH